MRWSLEIQRRLLESLVQRVMILLPLGATRAFLQVAFDCQGADQIQLSVTVRVQ
jgi:hypothetical protein